MNTNALAKKLIDALQVSRNPSGGWGYLEGGQSFVQPTALTELALRAVGKWKDRPPEKDLLQRCRLKSGLWSAFDGDTEGSWMTAFALLAFSCRKPASTELKKCTKAFLEWTHGFGNRLTPDFLKSAQQVYHLDFRLQGWPWFGDTATWVEPTAWAMKALETCGITSSTPRLQQARRYLADRACASGGWNYGNPHVLGQELEPLSLSTSAALIGLAAHRQDPLLQSSIEKGKRFLLRSKRSLSSLRASAWALIALRLLHTPESELAHIYKAWLEHLELGSPSEKGPFTWALSLLAINAIGRDPFVP